MPPYRALRFAPAPAPIYPKRPSLLGDAPPERLTFLI
jgi:hypothetical protein